MNLDEVIESSKPDPKHKTWWWRINRKDPSTAETLRGLIENFYDGDPETCAKVSSNVHLSRIVSIACEQRGVDITPEGARSWLRNWAATGRKWT
jgi:hypothetical protein